MKQLLRSFFVFLLMVQFMSANAQPWNGRQCAVALTYDDAIDAHLDHAVPALDSFGLKGTFYLIGSSGAVGNRISEWRKAAANGHELGNHTGFHPCDGSKPGRSFITPETDLNNYTVPRIRDEIRLTNILLRSIDGKTERTFAFPCGDNMIKGENYYDAVKKDFIAARGVVGGFIPVDSIHLHDINAFAINGQDGNFMINLVKKAQATHTLVVFLFHGVGGGHDLNVNLTAHRQLLAYLKANEKDIWVAPMIEIAKYAKGRKKDY